MSVRSPHLVSLSLLATVAACGAGKNVSTTPAIDTLPGGIVRVTNKAPSQWTDTNGWKLVLERTIAPADSTAGQLNQPGGIVVDSHGRIFVLDRKPTLIKVYASDGAFTGTIGREGSGPGEFQQWGILTISRDTLYHHDPRQSRTQAFTTDGALIHGWVSPCCWQMPAAADDSGRTPVPGMLRPDTTSKSFLAGAGYIRYHADGRVADTVIIPPQPEVKSWRVREKDNRMSMSVPLMPGMQSAFDRAGHYVWGQQGRYEIVISHNGLDTLRIFSSVAGTFPIPDSIRREEYDQAVKNNPMLKSVARFDDIPRYYPPWTSIVSDGDGNFWVIRPGARSDGDIFDVFSPEGVLLGHVPAPFHDRVLSFWTRDRVYTIQDDDASGVQSIKIYRIERPARRELH